MTALEESIQKSDKCESSLEVTAPNFIELKFDLDDGLLEEIKRVKNETDQYVSIRMLHILIIIK